MNLLLVAAVFSLIGSASAAAPTGNVAPISRDGILELARAGLDNEYWFGHGRLKPGGDKTSSCSGTYPAYKHTGDYGSDCSGYVAKAWQVPYAIGLTEDSHPFSTHDFRYRTPFWQPIALSDLKPGDALVYNKNGRGHIVLFGGRDRWGQTVALECRGCTSGCLENVRRPNQNYVAIRRNQLQEADAGGLDASIPGHRPPALQDGGQSPLGAVGADSSVARLRSRGDANPGGSNQR